MEIKKCSQCNRTDGIIIKNEKTNMLLCKKHYRQLQMYGHFLDNNPRMKSDPNEIIIYDNYAEIVLYNNNCYEVARTKIDIEDIEKISKHKWRMSHGYVVAGYRAIFLHRMLMDTPPDKVTDHINLDPLDNRKENLRICTQPENNRNKTLYSHNTSGVSGVCWDKSRNKWYAYIVIDNKQKSLGRFKDFSDAVAARKQGEIKYFGEYRCQLENCKK